MFQNRLESSPSWTQGMLDLLTSPRAGAGSVWLVRWRSTWNVCRSSSQTLLGYHSSPDTWKACRIPVLLTFCEPSPKPPRPRTYHHQDPQSSMFHNQIESSRCWPQELLVNSVASYPHLPRASPFRGSTAACPAPPWASCVWVVHVPPPLHNWDRMPGLHRSRLTPDSTRPLPATPQPCGTSRLHGSAWETLNH